MKSQFLLAVCVCCVLQLITQDVDAIDAKNRSANSTPKEVQSFIFSIIEGDKTNSSSSASSTTPEATTELQVAPTVVLTNYQTVHLKWKDFHDSAKLFMGNLVKSLIPKILQAVSKISITTKCMSSLIKLSVGLQEMKSWAVRMLDAMSKIPPGLLDATLSDMGDFDECVNIVHTTIRRNKKSVLRGQYCGVEVGLELPERPPHLRFNQHSLDFTNFTANDSAFRDIAGVSEYFYDNKLLLALCVPHACSRDDLQNFLNLIFESTPVNAHINGCYMKEELKVNKEQTAVLFVIGVFLTLALAGTICSSCCSKLVQSTKKDTPRKICSFLSAFAINDNFRKLWTSKRKEEHISCVDGIRVMTMIWLMIGHMILTFVTNATGRGEEGRKLTTYHAFQILVNSFIGADTFFFIGGLLMFYVNYIRIEKNKGKLDLARFFFHRLWRIMPPMWILLGFVFLLPMMGSGPLWHTTIDPKIESCRQNWWSVMSGINSWLQREDMCLQDMWYVSNDLHYFLLVPVMLIFLFKWPTIGLSIVFLFAVAATTAVAILTKVNDYDPVIIYTQPDKRSTNSMISNIHYRFYGHLVAYCTGIIVGYLLVKYPRFRIPTFLQVTGWVVAVGTSSLIVFSPYEWNMGHFPQQSISVAYASLHRAAWGLLVAWITYMCATGRGGFVNTILSWKSWRPLSNLSYAAYLVHFPYFWLRNGYRRERVSFSIYELLNELFAAFIMSGLIAIGFHLIFIAPLPNIEALIFQDKIKKEVITANGQMDMLDRKLKKQSKCDSKDTVNITSIEIIHT